MLGKAFVPLLLAVFLIQTGLAITLQIIEPSNDEYAWGNIPISAKLLNDSGSPIISDVHASIQGPISSSVNLTYNNGVYSGSFPALKMGYYTITVWSVVDGYNYTESKTVYVNSSKLEIDVLAPNGHYGPGQIPVKLNVLLAGNEANNITVNATIYRDGNLTWSKELSYPYNDLVSLDDGVYTFTAVAYADGTIERTTTSFTVSKNTFYIDIINPKNQTYPGKVPIDLDVWSDGEFVHHANVKAEFFLDGKLVKSISVPEAQYHYSSTANLGPGKYTMVAIAENNGNTVNASVKFTIPGVVEKNGTTTVIPGTKPMDIEEIWTNLQRRYYSPGSTGVIAVDLKDPNTGQYIKNANATACIHWDNKTSCLPMVYTDKPIPNYNAEFTFPDESWYEIVVNITAPGYKPATHRFPPIKVGKPPIIPPSGSEAVGKYIFTIVSPDTGTTYPAGRGIEVRVQLLDNEGMPVTNANVSAKIDNSTSVFPLEYDINGEYYANTEALSPGKHDLSIIVKTNTTSFSRDTTFTVSNNTLFVSIVNPADNANVTNRTITVQAEVKDQSGDIVPDADVKLIAFSPKTGRHQVEMTRDLSTGYYQVVYALDSPGKWRMNVSAEKEGMLPGHASVMFNATFEEKKTFSPRDIIAALVLIVAIVIISVIVKALV